ncbi:hypothetical protein N7495_008957 [Penicillium taxi]|uniref:uncharacterized protein n=1 Tax=Penicillium taxi TaxID=168475 RepID=UPI002545818C|nr:uncharacterized protein N7495_008957 [Penicillium taxi]KAJ5888916.1 hypothetical protein N7495_008957 [Penicillium taxi]
MCDTPRSERELSLTRFSTPVPELDDHRFQIDNRIETPLGQPRGYGETPERGGMSPMLNAHHETGPFFRDFEQIGVDDNRSAHGVNVMGRGFSIDPTAEFHSPRRISKVPQDILNGNISRPSSVSSSAPNSVEAFADPRRRERANTLESHVAPPDLEEILQRTVSGGTHSRRPTFSHTSAVLPLPGDVYFDGQDKVLGYNTPGRIPVIDYEELEEFVAISQKNKAACATGNRRKYSMSSQSKPRVFRDLYQGAKNPNVDELNKSDSANSSDTCQVFNDSDSTNEVVDEKELVETLYNANEPTRFGFFSSESQTTVHAAELGDLLLPGDTFRDLFQLGPEGGVWWMDVLNPTEEELHALAGAFSIHPLTTEDIMTQEAREKVELFKQYYFVCFRTFYQMDKTSEEFLEPVNIYMVVFRDGVLTFSFEENPHAASVRKRIGKLRDYVSLSSDWICYAMIDDIVDSFGPVIHEVEVESEAIEDHVFIARVDDFESFLPRIGGLRKKVMSLMRLLGGKADVIRGFSKRCNEGYSMTPRGDIGLYLGDIQDHVVTMMSNLGHFEKMLSRSHTNYLAQLNVTNLALGNHVNKVLSKITLLATILVPLNLISGLFGMNVNVPGKNAGGLGWFFGIMGVMGAVVVCQLTATAIIILSVLLLGIIPTTYAADVRIDGLETDNVNIGGVSIDGAGLSHVLNSFNGLELRGDVLVEGESVGLDLVRRLPNDATALSNNQFNTKTISMGDVQWWFITKEVVNGKHAPAGIGLPSYINSGGKTESSYVVDELRKRGEELSKRSTSVYLTLTTCKINPASSDSYIPGSFPQLEVYVSTSQTLQEPGPGKDSSKQNMTTSEEGYLGIEFTASGDVFIGVAAPNTTTYNGTIEYQIAASIDEYFQKTVDNDPFLYFVDSDHSAALLVTNNLTQSEPSSSNYQQWMNITPPYTMFAHNINNTALTGLSRSYCALDKELDRQNVDVSMTSRGLGNKPKEQFYMTGLNSSSTYTGILAMVGNSTGHSGNSVRGGGGVVWKSMNFTTKTDNNCAVLFNLDFCSEVAYAVPSNPNVSTSEMRQIYDDHAKRYFTNFSYSLQQIQCNTSQESMYSLAVNCDDCATAYKQWLCSVTIPRCADFTSTASYLQIRNAGQNFINGSALPEDSALRQSVVTNQSRNTLIDTNIKPGPYKEILPCSDICYNMVKKCPSALGFGCPAGKWMNSSYGFRDPNGDITCSYLGAAYYLSVGARLGNWGNVKNPVPAAAAHHHARGKQREEAVSSAFLRAVSFAGL